MIIDKTLYKNLREDFFLKKLYTRLEQVNSRENKNFDQEEKNDLEIEITEHLTKKHNVNFIEYKSTPAEFLSFIYY